MFKSFLSSRKKHLFLILLVFSLEFYAIISAWLKGYERMFIGCSLWTVLTAIFLLLWYAYKKTLNLSIDMLHFRHKAILITIVTLCVLVCTIPMDASPYWNGEIPQHRNQYEVMTEALLNGHLYLDYEVDPALTALENPYDPQQRIDSGAEYQWDHALYNGRYYMYFGIVPVFMAFLPYRLITGQPLTTYHATQLFTALIIITLFALFYLVAKLFFKHMSFSRYITLSISFSLLSIWYSVGFPAMYCTAITAAILLILWSLYLFIHAVWAEHQENTRIAYAFGGALCGALAFGCRPPIALANFLVLPMLATFLHKFPLTPARLGKLILAASPYLFIGILLMLYNYARFDNPFEFGQTYQLTIADQTQYSSFPALSEWTRILKTVFSNFFATRTRNTFGGVFVNFPILLVVFIMFSSKIRRTLKVHHLLGFCCILFLIPVMISFTHVIWSPKLLERYRMDIYFLLALLCFIIIGAQSSLDTHHSIILDFVIFSLSLYTIITCVWFFCIPFDGNWSLVFKPDIIDRIIHIMSLGFYR